MSPTVADYAASYVSQLGMSIVPLPPRSKRPLTENWGNLVISDADEARRYYSAHPDHNLGVALGPSRVCSFDVDDLEATRLIFTEFGWNLDELCEQYPTIQGSPGGFRVMFRVPDGAQLQYHALRWPKQDGSGHSVIWEIRAADTQQRQDVLPPSIHPDTGKPYIWLTRPSAAAGLPPPPDYLLALWSNWDALKPQLQAVCPWAKRKRPTPPPRPVQRQGDSVIDAYDQAHSIVDHLQRYGYTRAGNRYLSPHSSTKLAGVVVWEDTNRAWIHHASDPLCSDESGQPVAPFDLFAHYEHQGDPRAAARAAAQMLGMTRQPAVQQRQPAPERIDPDTGEILPAAPAIADQTEPLDVFQELAAPPMQLDMLPDAIAAYALDSGDLIGVDPAMIAIPALVTCAAALHDDVRIQPKRHETSWTESARLWCAIVGAPSIKKSPAIKRATRRLRKIDMDLHETNERDQARHAAEMEAYKDAKKEAKKTGEHPTPPEPARNERMVVEDITVEALSEILKTNSRGVLCIQDELSGWFGAMDAYSGNKAGGKDRAHWLEAYNGGGRVVDRVLRGSIKIPNWSVSMIGGIQPDAIRRIAQNMPDDGLMQRFMVVVGRNRPEQDRAENADAVKAFAALVDHVYAIQPGQTVVTLTEEAHCIREQLTLYATELADYQPLPGGLRFHLSKWSGLFARLLLTFHAIDCAAAHVHPATVRVSGDTASKVDRLMRRFLLPHALAYYTDVMGASGDTEHVRWIAGYILARQANSISNRDLLQHYRNWRGMSDFQRSRIMQALEDSSWVVPVDGDKFSRRGATAWTVNGRVHARFAELAQLERMRRDKIRDELDELRKR